MIQSCIANFLLFLFCIQAIEMKNDRCNNNNNNNNNFIYSYIYNFTKKYIYI